MFSHLHYSQLITVSIRMYHSLFIYCINLFHLFISSILVRRHRCDINYYLCIIYLCLLLPSLIHLFCAVNNTRQTSVFKFFFFLYLTLCNFNYKFLFFISESKRHFSPIFKNSVWNYFVYAMFAFLLFQLSNFIILPSLCIGLEEKLETFCNEQHLNT